MFHPEIFRNISRISWNILKYFKVFRISKVFHRIFRNISKVFQSIAKCLNVFKSISKVFQNILKYFKIFLKYFEIFRISWNISKHILQDEIFQCERALRSICFVENLLLGLVWVVPFLVRLVVLCANVSNPF